MPEEKDKKEKAKDLIGGLVKEALQGEVKSILSSMREGFAATLKEEAAKFRQEMDNAAEENDNGHRKIRFNPAEANAPFTTTGHVGDRGGYSFLRAIRAQLTGDWHEAKNEWGVHEELVKYGYAQQSGPGYWAVPLASDFMPDALSSSIKAMICESLQDVERKDVINMMRKVLSIGNDNLGGYLVEPMQAPEIIDLLRPQVVVMRAGATEIPLPPSGQLDLSRLNSGVDAQWVGENANLRTQITTNQAYGQVQLRAKKLATFQQLSSELISQSAPAAEAIVRSDMARKIAEKEDLTWLAGTGTAVQPTGIINTPSIISYTASTTAANGDTFTAQDVLLMVAEVEENNAVPQAWIMRPQVLAVILTRRTNQGTANAGEFFFDTTKDPTGRAATLLGGYPVFTTTQVSGTRIKGSGTTLSYIIMGMFSEALIGRMATLEIRASADAGTAFETDQVWLRGISRSDFALRHPAAFCFCDQLLQS